MAAELKCYSVTYVVGDSRSTATRVLHAKNRMEARGKVMKSACRPGKVVKIISITER